LIENAIEHGGTAIRIATELRGDHAVLSVSDNGAGVPENALGKIFEPMTTLSRRDEARGTGMGLAIAHKITSQIGGTIQVANGSAGLEIRVSLPREGRAQGSHLRALDVS
jgi:two-component system OmpR family sensor kinase